jgi:AbrB family looped-hinge helix DNA binding protein
MEKTMSLVKLKEKGQVTIPAAVRAQVGAHKGDVFEVVVSNGNIVLKPQEVISRKLPRKEQKRSGVDIGKYIGSAKGLFGGPEEIDAYVRKERGSWK